MCIVNGTLRGDIALLELCCFLKVIMDENYNTGRERKICFQNIAFFHTAKLKLLH